jgi:death-on-curing protein
MRSINPWRKTVAWGSCLPDRAIQFLSVDEVLAIHERVIEEFGGAPGVRDHGLVDSAVHRPRSGYYDELWSMAAALFESLLMNHPFVDGNKRVAFFATDVFLRINGFHIDVKADRAHAHLIGLMERREANKANLERWLRKHVTSLRKR